jgi:short-subunit dehydrogenase
MNDFKNKVIVITGSTQGIGKRTAELLAKRGAFIVINSRNQVKVSQIVTEFESKGFTVHGSAGDVSNFEYCEQLRNEVISKFGKIDLLINNAGIAVTGSLYSTDQSTFDHATRINFFGSIYPTKVFLEDLIKVKGGILFISPISRIVDLPGNIIYSSSKRAVLSIAQSLKNELHSKSVFVGVNFPGFLENSADKKNMLASDTIKKKNVGEDPNDKIAVAIIKQITQRKFKGFGSGKAWVIYSTHKLFPRLSKFIMKSKVKKSKL